MNSSEGKPSSLFSELDASNLAAMINNTTDLIWSVDRELRLITSNDPFDKVTRQNGRVVNKGDFILDGSFTEEQSIRFMKNYERALSGEAFLLTEYNESPTEYWLEISYTPIRQQGKIIGVACLSRDVSDRMRSEAQLANVAKEIAAYKYALDQANIVAITDRTGKIIHANDNFCRISKYDRSELIGRDHRIINSGFHSKDFIRNIWQTISKGNIWKGEIKNKAKDGSHYWVDTTIIPFLDPATNMPYQYLAIRADITSRKAIELSLSQSEAFNRGILNSLSSHIAVVDHKGNIVAVNEAWRRFAKENGDTFEEKTGVGNNYFQVCRTSGLVGEKDALKALQGFEDVMAQRKTLFYDEYPCHAPAKKRWFGMRIRNFDNRQPLVVVAHEDISERKIAEEELIERNAELQKTNTELDRFVYSASHDLRSPLTSVLGLLSFVDSESKEMQTLEYAKMIRHSVNRLDNLLKNIHEFSRNNRANLEVTKIDIAESVKEIISKLSAMEGWARMDFDVTFDETIPFFSDVTRLKIFMENLVSNAIKFQDQQKLSPYLKISGSTSRDFLFMQVDDNGIGIDPEYHGKIFDMFFRLAGPMAGAGIGLYVVRETISKLHGTIDVESQPATGTSFKIKLPNFTETLPKPG